MVDKTKIIRRSVEEPAEPALWQGMDPTLCRIYQARGVQHPQELERELAHLLPFTGLSQIDQAAELLFNALSAGHHLLIVGDFDADGATSTALGVRALRAMGAAKVSYLVPNRFEYGYGLTPEIVALAAEQNPDLIITVDNGIASCAGVKAARARGIEVLITDHHLPGDTLPEDCVIVNPNAPGDQFVSKHLAGVGVIFYVMLALRARLRQGDWFSKQQLAEPKLAELLDLVALGTVADVVPLDKNNRILVHQGLSRMRAGYCCVGIAAILKVAKRTLPRLVASDLGFAVGPRLNAAGRLDDMSIGIACLLSDDPAQAAQWAQQLDALNIERRRIEADMQQQAGEIIEQLQWRDASELPYGLSLFDERWHQGVIGILAGRIKERWHRPVVCFAKADDGLLKGSARSVKGLHLRDVLDVVAKQHPDVVVKFGGHAMAAGLSIDAEKLDIFTRAFADEVARHLSANDLQGQVLSDGELGQQQLTLAFADMLQQAGPWGQAFPEPIFDGAFSVIEQRIVGEKHLKMTLATEERAYCIDAIAFNVEPTQLPAADELQIAYRLDINEFRGQRRLQLIVEHFEPVAVGETLTV